MIKLPKFSPDNQYSTITTPVVCVTSLGLAGAYGSISMHSAVGLGLSVAIPTLFCAVSLWVGYKINRRDPDKPDSSSSGEQVTRNPRKPRSKKAMIDGKQDEKNSTASGYTKYVLEEDNWIDELLLESNRSDGENYISKENTKVKSVYTDLNNSNKFRNLIDGYKSDQNKLIDSANLVTNTSNYFKSRTFSLN